MLIGIVGNGVVGSATAKAYKTRLKADVAAWDERPERCTASLDIVLQADYVFLCLPTPANSDGSCDTYCIDAFLRSLNTPPKRHVPIVIKSTVPIGYTRNAARLYKLPNLLHSPEFLTARTSYQDALDPTRNVIGVPGADQQSFAVRLATLYLNTWRRSPLFIVNSNESEAVKLFQNSFSAVKISLFNEFRSIADKYDMNWESVLQALLAGGWINPMHTQVPGPDGLAGFGGACLPKDLSNLVATEKDLAPLCREALMRNTVDRNTIYED